MAEVKEMPKKAEAMKGQHPEPEVARPAAALMPWTEPTLAYMRRFAEEMDRLFEDFGLSRRLHSAVGRGRELLRREAGLIPAEWSPRIEILERDGRYIVRADLPGMTKDDIKVEVTDEMLTIQGERKQEKEEKREGYYYGERAYGGFYRTIPLPEGADPAKATAEFHNGVLEVTMPAPKKPEKKSRLLEVQDKK
ncbi:MAG TPA: Hsp20/alpha crystallin family protein [Isosphaeraceae bacterium]|nr:Hsp20/alpha crystallin family protein [Isosphaeraceae bacterium]